MKIHYRFAVVFFLFCLLSFSASCSSGGGGDDDSGGSTDDDDSAECIICQTTPDCTAAMGAGWVCIDECCKDMSGDDDSDDDVDDDSADDDVTDDDVTDDDTTDDDTSGGDVWTDSTSGLMWQVEVTAVMMAWDSAISYCQDLILGGYDDWRLPTISELRSLIRGCDATETGGSCGLTDECLESSCEDISCDGCSPGGGPDGGCYSPSPLGNACDYYWSSSAVADDASHEWSVDFHDGLVGYSPMSSPAARCVRP